MISVPSISVGSSVFFSLALLIISIVALFLLRRFLTLRATPAYLSVPVFLALALPASVVLLVPIDLASSSRDDGSPKAIWLPDRLILVSWRIAYWLIFVLTWFVIPSLWHVAFSLTSSDSLGSSFRCLENMLTLDIVTRKRASNIHSDPMPAIS